MTTSGIVGYILCKYDFPGKNAFFLFILATMMVPFFVFMVPLFQLIVQFGWYNSFKGLIFPGLFNSFGIFLLKQFSAAIPDELLDAARIDGASELRIFLRIALPILSPALATLAIFVSISSWGSYLWPLIVLTDHELQTLPLGLALLQLDSGQGGRGGVSFFGQMLAGNVLAVIPVLIVFFIFQRRITEGIALTGLGGH
ncbi:MAG: carbohydrate ABC transporter permease [Anaerolineales bacterium]